MGPLLRIEWAFLLLVVPALAFGQSTNTITSTVTGTTTVLSDMKIELKDDITEVFRNIDRQEGRNRGNVEDVRQLISAFELRVDSKMTRLDEQIDTLESKLDLRIKQALENPLSQ